MLPGLTICLNRTHVPTGHFQASQNKMMCMVNQIPCLLRGREDLSSVNAKSWIAWPLNMSSKVEIIGWTWIQP